MAKVKAGTEPISTKVFPLQKKKKNTGVADGIKEQPLLPVGFRAVVVKRSRRACRKKGKQQQERFGPTAACHFTSRSGNNEQHMLRILAPQNNTH